MGPLLSCCKWPTGLPCLNKLTGFTKCQVWFLKQVPYYSKVALALIFVSINFHIAN